MRPASCGIAPEGWPCIGLAVFTTLVLSLLGCWLAAALGWVITLFCLHFFRDPERVIPQAPGLAVSSGIIGSTDRAVDGYTLPCVINTADISHGSSGGALLNIYGRVAAVTAGAYTYGNNMYLAVPVDAVFDVDRTAEGQLLKDATAEYQAVVKAETDKKS